MLITKVPEITTICKSCFLYPCDFYSCTKDCDDCIIRCCMCSATDCSTCYRDCKNRKEAYEPSPIL